MRFSTDFVENSVEYVDNFLNLKICAACCINCEKCTKIFIFMHRIVLEKKREICYNVY